MKNLILLLSISILLLSCSENKAKNELENCADYKFSKYQYDDVITKIHNLRLLDIAQHKEISDYFRLAKTTNQKEIASLEKKEKEIYNKLWFEKVYKEGNSYVVDYSKSYYRLSNVYKKELLKSENYSEIELKEIEKEFVESFKRIRNEKWALKREQRKIKKKGQIFYGSTKEEAIKKLTIENKIKIGSYMREYKKCESERNQLPDSFNMEFKDSKI